MEDRRRRIEWITYLSVAEPDAGDFAQAIIKEWIRQRTNKLRNEHKAKVVCLFYDEVSHPGTRDYEE